MPTFVLVGALIVAALMLALLVMAVVSVMSSKRHAGDADAKGRARRRSGGRR